MTGSSLSPELADAVSVWPSFAVPPITGVVTVGNASSTGPVVAGITVYESYAQPDVSKSGVLPLPKPKETVLGGHAISIVGYDDSKKQFKFLNSWGAAWGEKGFGYVSYDYMKDNSDVVARFTRASVEGWKDYLRDPSAGNALIRHTTFC